MFISLLIINIIDSIIMIVMCIVIIVISYCIIIVNNNILVNLYCDNAYMYCYNMTYQTLKTTLTCISNKALPNVKRHINIVIRRGGRRPEERRGGRPRPRRCTKVNLCIRFDLYMHVCMCIYIYIYTHLVCIYLHSEFLSQIHFYLRQGSQTLP